MRCSVRGALALDAITSAALLPLQVYKFQENGKWITGAMYDSYVRVKLESRQAGSNMNVSIIQVPSRAHVEMWLPVAAGPENQVNVTRTPIEVVQDVFSAIVAAYKLGAPPATASVQAPACTNVQTLCASSAAGVLRLAHQLGNAAICRPPFAAPRLPRLQSRATRPNS